MLPRADALHALASEAFDVLVIGGGITGAGVALDAATRGYSVALVERADYASGTSSRSSKLVHGGLRYLQNFDLGLVREALLERQINVNLAPHLVRPLRFVVTAFDGARLDRVVGLGLNAYDVMAVDRLRRRRRDETDWSPARHRVISGPDVLELLPALANRAPTGGYLFYDCQTDDARLVLTVLAEAERFGAVAANRLEAVAVTAQGARVRDAETQDEREIRARHVVNATGVWADRLRTDVPVIQPSRGTHLVLDAQRLPLNAAAVVPAGERRNVFALPWLGQTLIGTTDSDHHGPIDRVRPHEADIAYLLNAVNAFFHTAFTPADLAGAFAGVRPLVSSNARTVDISRRAELYESANGMITITGGKLTTWRRMAEQTVDRLTARDGRDARCVTDQIPLGRPADDLPAHLAARYGEAGRDVLARADLLAPILPGHPDLLAEVAYAAGREQARTVGDVLLRRTRLGLLAPRRLLADHAAIDRVAAILGAELRWDAARVEREAQAFRREVDQDLP